MGTQHSTITYLFSIGYDIQIFIWEVFNFIFGVTATYCLAIGQEGVLRPQSIQSIEPGNTSKHDIAVYAFVGTLNGTVRDVAESVTYVDG